MNLIYNRHFGNRYLDKNKPIYDEIFNRENKLYFNNGSWSRSYLFTDEELEHVLPKNRSQKEIKKNALFNNSNKKKINNIENDNIELLQGKLQLSAEKKNIKR